jgi:hypothetical protein
MGHRTGLTPGVSPDRLTGKILRAEPIAADAAAEAA